MNNEKIIADDMNAALREVKERFGPDAFILESQTLRERVPGTMKTRSRVELTVSLQSPAEVGRKDVRPLELDAHGRFIDEGPGLEAEIRRIEKIVSEIEEHEGQLRGFGSGYPLLGELRDYGLFESTIQRLVQDFEEEVPRVEHENPQVALERIRNILRCVGKMKMKDLRGIHALVGPPGVGRTSLAIKLAQRVSDAGRKVVILGYRPGHEGDVARLEAAARELGFELAVAEDQVTLLGALRHLIQRDLIILDMPPLESEQWKLLDRVEENLHREPIFKHLVLAADGGWRDLAEAATESEFLAITRADLSDALRPALDLMAHGEASVGFISSGPKYDSPLEIARVEELSSQLESRVLKSRAMTG